MHALAVWAFSSSLSLCVCVRIVAGDRHNRSHVHTTHTRKGTHNQFVVACVLCVCYVCAVGVNASSFTIPRGGFPLGHAASRQGRVSLANVR